MLSSFYVLRPVELIPALSTKLQVSCDILRQESFIKPLHGPEQNPQIPDFYYSIRSFVPNVANDYLTLDRVLGNQNESVVISMRVESADVSG